MGSRWLVAWGRGCVTPRKLGCTRGTEAQLREQRPGVGAQGRSRCCSCPGETDVDLNAETCLALNEYL